MSQAAIIASEGLSLNGPGGNLARRRYQQGRLFQRGKDPNKVWVGRWREDVTDGFTLRRVYRAEVLGSVKDFPTRRLALRELQRKLDGVNSSSKPRVNMTLREFAERFKSSALKRYKPSTQANTISQLDTHIIPALGDVKLNELTAEVVQRFVITQPGSKETVRARIGKFRMLWKTAREWGYVSSDPFTTLHLPQYQIKRERRFTVEEIQKILAAAEEPFKTYYWIAAETGMRMGEISALEKRHFDPIRKVLRVEQSVWNNIIGAPKTKTGTRTCPVSKQLAEHIAAFLRSKRDDELMFCTKHGKPLYHTFILQHRLYPLLDKLGIPRRGIHAFRHANGTLMDQIGAPVKIRQERLGHSDPRTTLDIYTDAVASDNFKVAEQIGAILHPTCTQVDQQAA